MPPPPSYTYQALLKTWQKSTGKDRWHLYPLAFPSQCFLRQLGQHCLPFHVLSEGAACAILVHASPHCFVIFSTCIFSFFLFSFFSPCSAVFVRFTAGNSQLHWEPVFHWWLTSKTWMWAAIASIWAERWYFLLMIDFIYLLQSYNGN